MITIGAHFDGKAIVPDEPVDLPIGKSLVVRIETASDGVRGRESAVDWLIANAVDDDLPSDLGAEHDHYLYGSPKRS